MQQPIRILIADDHLMVREGLKQILELDGDIEVVAQADDGIQCLQQFEQTSPDVILLDINMPNMNGLEALEEIRKKTKEQKVLILTIHNEVEYLMKAVEIGINGYVLKDSEASALKKAIFLVYEGEIYIEPSLTPALKERAAQGEKLNAILTRREVEVLKLLAEGLFNKEIAYRLSISEKTVKNHVSNIFRKIGVADRTQAAVYAIKNNFIDIA